MYRLLLAASLVVLVGCSSKSSLIALSDEAAGEHCANGGAKIQSGLDANGDGTLDASEVSSTSYVCSGVAGPSGTNGTSCTVADSAGVKTISCAGGTQVTISDGAKGDTGATGATGETGPAGANGDSCAATDNGNGTVTFTCGNTSVTVTLGGGNGGSAHNSLVAMTADTSGTCANGGTVVQSGLDVNDNDTLDTGEVTSTQYVCNGANGSNGANGDAGANGTNGTDGSNGHNSLVSLSNADAAACPTGGTTIQAGVDLNDNGTLDSGEVLNTRNVCNGATGATGAQGNTGAAGPKGDAGTNGADGKNSLITITTEAAGTNCPTGGKKIQVGVDANGNGTLDTAEATTSYVCNGAAAGSSIYGTGQDGALTVAAGGLNWVTSPPSGSMQYSSIVVNGPWTIPSGLKIRSTGVITIAAGGSITVQASAVGLGIASTAPQGTANDASSLAGGTGMGATLVKQLFNPSRFGGGVGGGGSTNPGGGGGSVVLLAGGAVSLASGTSINANGGAGITSTTTANSGGGGGGGIVVVLSNVSITNAGTISAVGGKGADYISPVPTPSLETSAGGGGGGGLIQLGAPSIANAGTLNVGGGAAGAGASSKGYAGGGGGSVGNGGISGGAAGANAAAGTIGASFTTVTTDPAALFLTSLQP